MSSRIRLNKSVFHSNEYERKGSSDSFTICFTNNNQEFFVEIDSFFEYENKHYCFIKVCFTTRKIITKV